MITRHRPEPGSADPTWLLPVVAPMVAAALGPALVPHLPEGQARATLLLGCHALFGASLLATLVLLPGIWTRLAGGRPSPVTLTPRSSWSSGRSGSRPRPPSRSRTRRARRTPSPGTRRPCARSPSSTAPP